jgi:hypothetical protein
MTCKYESVVFLEKPKTNFVHFGLLNRWGLFAFPKGASTNQYWEEVI